MENEDTHPTVRTTEVGPALMAESMAKFLLELVDRQPYEFLTVGAITADRTDLNWVQIELEDESKSLFFSFDQRLSLKIFGHSSYFKLLLQVAQACNGVFDDRAKIGLPSLFSDSKEVYQVAAFSPGVTDPVGSIYISGSLVNRRADSMALTPAFARLLDAELCLSAHCMVEKLPDLTSGAVIPINSLSVTDENRLVRVYITDEHIELSICEESMSPKDEHENRLTLKQKPIEVLVGLGAIRLSLDEVMKLRPGTTLKFPRPEVFDSTLYIDGEPWADTVVEITSEGVLLKILEIRKFCSIKQLL